MTNVDTSHKHESSQSKHPVNHPHASLLTFAVSQDSWKSHVYEVPGLDDNGHITTKASPMHVTTTVLDRTNAIVPFTSATSILDVACGPGTVYAYLFSSKIPLAPGAQLLATDLSEPMVGQIAARQAEKRPGDDQTWARVQAWAADATDLSSVPDASQSHVLSVMGIYLIPDAGKALAEVKRVMRTDAPAVFTMSSVARAAWMSDVLGIIEELHPERKMPRTADKWRRLDLNKAYLEGEGFKNVYVEEVKMAMAFEDEREFVDMMWGRFVPMMGNMGTGLTEEEIENAKGKIVERLKEKYPDKELPGMALVATATV